MQLLLVNYCPSLGVSWCYCDRWNKNKMLRWRSRQYVSLSPYLTQTLHCSWPVLQSCSVSQLHAAY